MFIGKPIIGYHQRYQRYDSSSFTIEGDQVVFYRTGVIYGYVGE
jgi:hypothetical protein